MTNHADWCDGDHPRQFISTCLLRKMQRECADRDPHAAATIEVLIACAENGQAQP